MIQTVEIDRNKLRDVRKQHGMTGLRLSKMAGCGNQYLSSIESGKAHPSDKLIARMASALGVPPEEICLSSGDPDPIKARMDEIWAQLPRHLQAKAYAELERIAAEGNLTTGEGRKKIDGGTKL